MWKKIILNTFFCFLFVIFSNACSGIPRSTQEIGYYSYPVTSNAVETNRITSVINDDKYISKSSNNRIILNGKIIQTNLMAGWFPIRPFRLEVSEMSDAEGELWLPPYKYTFRWTGQVSTHNGNDFFVDFEVYGHEDGSQKYFVLQEALFDDVTLDLPNPFEIPFFVGEFPYLIGYIQLPSARYRIMSVNNYQSSDTEIYKQIFYHPSQLFQILDDDDTVVAELEKDECRIFDTLSGQERESIKKGIYLLYTFRHATLVLKNSNYGWEIPSTKDMVYP